MRDDISDTLKSIKMQGYVESSRDGNTGIGKTLEDLMGVRENNRRGPDLIGIELKATRRDSNASTTLFTKEPKKRHRRIWNDRLIEKYGYEDGKGRDALKCNVKCGVTNQQGLSLVVEDDYLYIDHEDDQPVAAWRWEEIEDHASNKMPSMLYIIADRKREDGNEYFWFNEGYYLDDFSTESFRDLVESRSIDIDLRMHLDENGLRNRGTAWRLKNETKFDQLYETRMPCMRGRIDIANETGQHFLWEYQDE